MTSRSVAQLPAHQRTWNASTPVSEVCARTAQFGTAQDERSPDDGMTSNTSAVGEATNGFSGLEYLQTPLARQSFINEVLHSPQVTQSNLIAEGVHTSILREFIQYAHEPAVRAHALKCLENPQFTSQEVASAAGVILCNGTDLSEDEVSRLVKLAPQGGSTNQKDASLVAEFVLRNAPYTPLVESGFISLARKWYFDNSKAENHVENPWLGQLANHPSREALKFLQSMANGEVLHPSQVSRMHPIDAIILSVRDITSWTATVAILGNSVLSALGVAWQFDLETSLMAGIGLSMNVKKIPQAIISAWFNREKVFQRCEAISHLSTMHATAQNRGSPYHQELAGNIERFLVSTRDSKSQPPQVKALAEMATYRVVDISEIKPNGTAEQAAQPVASFNQAA